MTQGDRTDSLTVKTRRIPACPRGTLGILFSLIFAHGATPSEIDAETVKRWSAPYRNWHYHPAHVIPAKPDVKGFEKVHMTDVPTVYQRPGDKKWHMTFIGFDGKCYQSFVAESDDLVHWTNPRVAMGYGPKDSFDHGGVVLGAFLYEDYDIKAPRTLRKKGGNYYSLYGAYPRQGGYELRPGYEGVASSEDGLSWKRAKDAPILSVHQEDCGAWEKDCIYQPWLVEHEGRFLNFYNAARGHIEQIGLALSDDLLHWRRHGRNPVIPNGPKGSYNEKFSSDGKVFRDGDHWVMFFFGVGRGGAHIMTAFSRNLRDWTADPEPLYKAGGNPSGLDKKYAHKISLVWNPGNKTYYMFYNAVGNKGRGIGLITSKALAATVSAQGVDDLAGNRVMFLGDSITHGGGYISMIEYFLRRKYPGKAFDMIGIGLGSETASGLSEKTHPFPRPCVHERLDRALAKVKPDVVVACYGMNDGIYWPQSEERMEAYREGIRRLVDKCRKAGAKIVLMTPPPFDPAVNPERLAPAGADDYSYRAPYEKYHTVLEDYARWILSLDEKDVVAVDLNGPMTACLKARYAAEPDFRSGDGIHPGPWGHYLMAAQFLAAFDVELQRKDIDIALAAMQADPLYKLVDSRRKTRGNGWRDYVGYTRRKTVTRDRIDDVEEKAAGMLGEINRHCREN